MNLRNSFKILKIQINSTVYIWCQMATDNAMASINTTKTLTTATPHGTIKQDKTMNMNNMLLTNNTKFAKLPSLGPPRDLTLGGRGGTAAKKVFLPNLNVVRNKNTNVKTAKDLSIIRGRGRGTHNNTNNRANGPGGRGGKSNLIQTSGVFSEGAGAVDIRKSSYSGSSSYSRTNDTDTPSQMRRPTINKNENRKIDMKAEAEHIRELIGDSDDDDFIEVKTEKDQIPIKLNEVKWKDFQNEIKIEKIKIEDDMNVDENASPVAVAQKIQALHIQSQRERMKQSLEAVPKYPQSVDEMLKSKEPKFFLMQLPDVLPCEDHTNEVKETNEDVSNVTNMENSRSSSPSPATKTPQHIFKNMPEGQVGKLIRYKSGKYKLLLGETYFDIGMGMEPGFLQELMSINTNRDERNGNMINLGPIDAKLTVTPDWESLLEKKSDCR